jgi:hypothetical protein
MTEKRINGGSQPFRIVGKVAIFIALMLGNSSIASAFTASDRDACWSAWTNAFYFTDAQGCGYFRLQEKTNTPIGFFEYAICIQAVEDATNYPSVQANMVNALCAGFTNVNGTDWSWDPFNDDLGWASIAFSRAYQLTGNTQWKALAKNGFDVAYNRGFDPTDGGIFQSTDNTEPKATVGSQTSLLAAYLIYQNYGVSSYLSKAQSLYKYVTNNFIDANGEVMGAADTPASAWGLANSDNGMFAIASLDLGFTNNAYLSCDFVTNYWSVAMDIQPLQNTANGPQNGVGLQGMARAGRDIAFQQAALDDAWSWRNSRNLVHCAWNQRLSDTNLLYCGDCMSVVMGMMNVPPSAPATLPVTASDVVGRQVTFNAAFGGSNLNYQWQKIKSGTTNNIVGATNATLTLSNLQFASAASYQCQASNAAGVVVSIPASLTVANISPAVNNMIASYAAQTGLGDGYAFTPSWNIVPGSLIAGQIPSTTNGDFDLEPNYGDRSVNGLTSGGGVTLTPGGGVSTTASNNYVTCGNGGSPAAGATIVYALTGAAQGYNVTNITVCGGWINNSRDAQACTVYYSTVSAPAIFIQMGSINYNPVNTGFDPLNPTLPRHVPCATRAVLTPASGVLASNVAVVKFDFTNPASENGYCGYAKINVYGIPAQFPPSTNPTNIIFQLAANSLILRWPADHVGWRLQVQTNGLVQGLGTNWLDVPGSTSTNQMTLPINQDFRSVFYRMVYP